jgi:hypothetical protein
MITTISSLSKGSPSKGTIQGKSKSEQAFRPSKGTTTTTVIPTSPSKDKFCPSKGTTMTTVIPTSPSKDNIHQPTIRHLEASIRIKSH